MDTNKSHNLYAAYRPSTEAEEAADRAAAQASNRTRRCSTCSGQGVVLVQQPGQYVRGPDGKRRVATQRAECHCRRDAALDLGHRRRGMLGTASTADGKHGAKGRTPLGELSKPQPWAEGYGRRLAAWQGRPCMVEARRIQRLADERKATRLELELAAARIQDQARG